MDPLPPIPTPPSQRWREFRIQALPVLTFIAVLVCVAFLWNSYVLPTNIVGEVETIHANVISTLPGTIKELKVTRFQRVKAGDEIVLISTMDVETVQASLRAIEADLKLMRARMQIDVERNIQNYETLRLDYLKELVELQWERVSAIYYDQELARQEQLVTNSTTRLLSLTEYDYWKRLAATTRTNVTEREKYLAEKAKILPTLAPKTEVEEVILENIKALQEQLRLTEQPISLKAPIDGMVSFVANFPGQKVAPNVPIVVISGMQATRIVAYMRKPFDVIPKPGDTVQIRRQVFKREVAQGTVLEVSGQLELISPTLVPPLSGSLPTELGLPFAVSIPVELALIPGEAVDLILNKR